MYKRINNTRGMVVGLVGIVIVMSIFTWLMYGIAKRIDQMTVTMIQLSHDVHTMTEAQKTMGANIGMMANNTTAMAHNMAIMTGNTTRMSYDVGRTSRMLSSPMSYFWNTGP